MSTLLTETGWELSCRAGSLWPGYSERLMSDKGDYPWILHLISRFPNSVNDSCIWPYPLPEYAGSDCGYVWKITPKGITLILKNPYCLNPRLWDSLVDFMPFRFFWKDREHRFLGASHNFLTYYNVSLRDIVGRRNWCLVHWFAPVYRRWEPLHGGREIIRNTEGTTVVNGITRHILSSKIPIFSNGRVIGLIGYFITEGDFKAVEASRRNCLPWMRSQGFWIFMVL